MTGIKQAISKLLKWEYTALCVLLLIVMALHLSTITQPAQPIFDEQFYVPAANSILAGNGSDRIDHPPLAQLIIASGIRLFGDNSFGWRIFSILFGIIGLAFFYFICRQLKIGRKYAYLATFLLSFENLTFVQSSVAMLDVFSLTFMLAAFWLYLKGRHAASGIMVVLATLSKLTGVLAVLVIGLHWLLTNRKRWKGLFIFAAASLATFSILFPLLEFLIWRMWLNPVTQVQIMLKANSLATFSIFPHDAMMSRPWEWLARLAILTYWIDPHYLAMISPPIWALIIPADVFLVYKSLKRNSAALFALAWFTGTYIVWVFASFLTNRISYIYYFYPVVGSACIAISLAFSDLDDTTNRISAKTIKKLLGLMEPAYLLLCLGAFVILSPVSYWWKAPLCVVAYLLSRYYMEEEDFTRTESAASL